MIKIIPWLFLLLLLVTACNKPVEKNLETQLSDFKDMEAEAKKNHDELQNKEGKNYCSAHDDYYELMNKRAYSSITYLDKIVIKDPGLEDFKMMLDMAKIAKDEQHIIDISRIIFGRFPETLKDKQQIQLFFSNSYLIEPPEAEKYLDLTMFPLEEQLFCYYMLALGFSESDNIEKAKAYYEKAENLFNAIVADTFTKNTLPILYIIGLQTFIAERIGDKQKAFGILAAAENKFTDATSQNLRSLYENRLNTLGRKAWDLETQFSIGQDDPISLALLKGKVILLDFFTWDCEVCSLSIPYLVSLKKRINNDDFVIIGSTRFVGSYEGDLNISEQTEYTYMKDHYYKKRKISWPISINNTGMFNYGINSTPTYVLIDKQGIVRDGYYISNYSYLEKKITELLRE